MREVWNEENYKAIRNSKLSREEFNDGWDWWMVGLAIVVGVLFLCAFIKWWYCL